MPPIAQSLIFRRALTVCLLAGALAVGLAACGSSSVPPSVATARYQARLTLAKCLRAHGLDVPDPKPGGGAGGGTGFGHAFQSFPPAQVASAKQACAKYFAASSGLLSANPTQLAQIRAQAVKYAECMRSHGVDIPDPTISGLQSIGGGGIVPTSINQNTPAFKSANGACGSLRPKFGSR